MKSELCSFASLSYRNPDFFWTMTFFYNLHNKVEPTSKLPCTSFRFLQGQRLKTFSDVWTNQIRISVRNKGLPSPKLTYPWKLPKFRQRESPTPGRSQRSLKIGSKWKPSSKILKIESDWRSIRFIYLRKTNISIISPQHLLVLQDEICFWVLHIVPFRVGHPFIFHGPSGSQQTTQIILLDQPCFPIRRMNKKIHTGTRGTCKWCGSYITGANIPSCCFYVLELYLYN